VPEAKPPVAAPKVEGSKFRVVAIIAALAVLIAVGAVLELRSHRSEPTAQTAEEGKPDVAPQAQIPEPKATTSKPSPETPAPETPAPAPVPETARSSAAPETDATAPEEEAASPGAVKGAVTERVMPEVPEKATATIHGKFELAIRASVDADGAVSNAVLDSPGPSRYFANLAIQAVRQWKFKAAQVDGRAVPSVWVLTFQFSQASTEVAPVEVSP
jgi:protein TonB